MKGDKFLDSLEFIDADLIDSASRVSPRPKRTVWFKRVAIAACATVLVLAAVTLPYVLPKLYTDAPPDFLSSPTNDSIATNASSQAGSDTILSYLTLDINPSIQFAVEDGIVVKCIALNDDAEEILQDLELIGLSVEDALPLVLNKLIELGYLAADEYAPVLLLSARGNEDAWKLLETATSVTASTLTEQEVSTYIVSQEENASETYIRLAEEYNVSVGKMQYVLDRFQAESNISLDNMTEGTIIELYGMDIEKGLIAPKYKVGEYDEYGEQVLYVGTHESTKGYTPWEEIPEEIKQTYYDIYTPEELELMNARIWTTMPSVLGLTAQEAYDLLWSRNIVARILYENNPQAREDGYIDGQCFMQDTPQGMRLNSGAGGVFIWILVPEDDPRNQLRPLNAD